MTTTTQPPTLPVLDTLLQLLSAGNTTIDSLCQALATTPEILEQLLDSPDCQDRLRLQTKLAQTALKLQVAKLLPQAQQKIADLMNSDKPEVARRAANTILHLNGLCTTSAKSLPYQAPPPAQSTQSEDQGFSPLMREKYDKALQLLMEGVINYPAGIPADEINDILEAPQSDGSPAELELAPNVEFSDEQLQDIEVQREARAVRRQQRDKAELDRQIAMYGAPLCNRHN